MAVAREGGDVDVPQGLGMVGRKGKQLLSAANNVRRLSGSAATTTATAGQLREPVVPAAEKSGRSLGE